MSSALPSRDLILGLFLGSVLGVFFAPSPKAPASEPGPDAAQLQALEAELAACRSRTKRSSSPSTAPASPPRTAEEDRDATGADTPPAPSRP